MLVLISLPESSAMGSSVENVWIFGKIIVSRCLMSVFLRYWNRLSFVRFLAVVFANEPIVSLSSVVISFIEVENFDKGEAK